MSETWVNATLFFKNEQIAKEWEHAFALLKDEKWQEGINALIAKGCQCMAEEKEGMPLVTLVQQKSARLDIRFLEGAVYCWDFLNEISKAGATHISASGYYSTTFSTDTLYKIGKKKVKYDTFIESISAVDDEYAFIQAINKGNAKEAQRLLEKGINPNVELSPGWYPIHQAVEKSKPAIVDLLLAAGADINMTTCSPNEHKNERNRTAVHIALSNRRPPAAMLKRLFTYKPDLSIRDIKGKAPLDYVMSPDSLDIIDLLLKAGAQINARDPEGKTAVFHSSWSHSSDPESDYIAFLDAVESRGADLFATSHNGTNLRWEKGGSRVTREYLEAKGVAFARPVDAYNEKPIINLLTAIRHYDIEKIRELVNSGIDLDEPVEIGWNRVEPVLCYAANFDFPDVVKILLDAGAHVNAARVLYGETPLHYAAWSGDSEAVKLLIQRGADVNATTNAQAPSKYGETPLMEAAGRGFLEVVGLLIGHGADVNAATVYGETALMKASYEGFLNVVRLLVEHGADVNARATHNGSPTDAFLRALDNIRHASDVLDYLFPLWRPTEVEKSCGIKLAKGWDERKDWLDKIKQVPVSDKQ